jgi:TetR/AcrR family transcriptional repressor of lmrAB and yxaGH operons
MPRTARERLLAGAIQLMARDGVAGMGVAELIEHSKVSRRSVYVNFPRGKAELVADATKSAGEIITGVLEKLVQQAPVSSALASLGALVGAHVAAGSDYTMGCPIAAATLGRPEAPEASQAAHAAFAQWVDLLAGRLEKDGIDPCETESLATAIVAAVEGAVLMSLAARSTDPLDRVIQQMVRLVELSTPIDPKGAGHDS